MIRRLLAPALFTVATFAASPPAGAQLPHGWIAHERTGVVGSAESIACSRDHAYVRDWSGVVAVWDGAQWSTLPRISRTRGSYGRTIAVAPDGHVLIEASGGLAEWDGTRWIEHALDAWEGDVDAQIAAPAAGEAYYVGRGRIARREGADFHTYSAGTWRALFGVGAVAGRLWIAGQGGTLMRRDGARWTRLPTHVDSTLMHVRAFAPNDLWAWGAGASYRESTVLHCDETTCERRDAQAALPGAIHGLGGTADTVYAAGDFGLARWSGHAWSMELAVADFGPGYHAPKDVCATDHHFIVADGSGALTRPR